MEIEQLYKIYRQHTIVCTDTRKIQPDSLFFALKGDSFNANSFASEALEAGAAYAIIDDAEFNTHPNCILVDNVLTTLQQLAAYHRKQLQIPFIGITGTNGKTTTKELLNSVLSQKFKTYATIGNLNNHIGVPLTLLAIDDSIEVAIIEMGANHQKEIEFLCTLAQPTHGLITNVGKAHLEGFGGFSGVKSAKGELYNYLNSHHAITFINAENSHLAEMAALHKLTNIVYYGAHNQADITGKLTAIDPVLHLDWWHSSHAESVSSVATHLTGAYNFENVLAAICVGNYLKLTPQEINVGIDAYKPVNNRSQLTKTEKNTLICDYYNANPSSMLVALDNIARLKAEKKVVILGDMFELGHESEVEHQLVLEKALSIGASPVILIGNAFYQLQSSGAAFFKTVTEACEYLNKQQIENATILIKGSRGMKLEQTVPFL